MAGPKGQNVAGGSVPSTFQTPAHKDAINAKIVTRSIQVLVDDEIPGTSSSVAMMNKNVSVPATDSIQ
jgi:hypothetical protein